MIVQTFAAIALNGFREARRNRVTVVLALFASLLLATAWLMSSAAVATVDRVLVDSGLASMSLMLVLLTVFLSSGLLSREIERKTIFLVVSRPVPRWLFLTARLAGNMLTVGVLLVAMSLLFFGELVLFRAPLHSSQFVAAGMLWLELLVIASVGLAISSFSGQLVSLFVTAAIYFSGHLAGDIYRLANKADSSILKALGKSVYYLLPNLDRLNYRPHAAYSLVPSPHEVFASAGYAVAYSAVMVGIAILVFERRDFK